MVAGRGEGDGEEKWIIEKMSSGVMIKNLLRNCGLHLGVYISECCRKLYDFCWC